MILPKYQPNFERLGTEEALHLAHAMALPESDQLSGLDIYQVGNEAGLDQADVVMSLATDSSPLGVRVVETLVGHPITRARQSPPRVRGQRVRGVSVRRSDPRRIAFVIEPNPKKAGSASADRFAHYEVGVSVDEFVKRGGTLGDVKWDLEHGFIRLEEGSALTPETEPQEQEEEETEDDGDISRDPS